MNKRNLFSFLITVLFCFNIYAQSSSLRKFGLNFQLGTTPSISLAYQALPKLALKANYTYFMYNLNQNQKISGEDILLKGNLNINSAGLVVEILPFQKSTFKIIGGASYLQKGSIHINATPTKNYVVGNTTFTPEEVGSFLFDLSYDNGIAPFLGIGFGRSVPKKRIGVGFEIGSYYLPKPKVMLSGTERLANMSEQQETIQSNMNDWRYWPIVNLQIAVRLN